MIDIFTKDSFRKRIEGYSNGRLTILYDRWGNPSIMSVIPKMRIKDVIKSFDSTGNFININGLNSFNYEQNRFQPIFSLLNTSDDEINLNSVHPAFLVKNEDGSFEELNEIFVGTFLSTFSNPYSLPDTEIIDEINGNFKGSSSRNIAKIIHQKNLKPDEHQWRCMNAWIYNLIRLYMLSRADESLRTIYGGFDSYGNLALTGLDNNKFKLNYTNIRKNKDIYIYDGCISKFLTDDLYSQKCRQKIPLIAKGDQVYSLNTLKDIGEVKESTNILYKLEFNNEISQEIFPNNSEKTIFFEFDVFFDNILFDREIINASTICISYDSNTFNTKFIGSMDEGTELFIKMGERVGILSGIEYVTEKKSSYNIEEVGGDTIHGRVFISNVPINILSIMESEDTTSLILYPLSKNYLSGNVRVYYDDGTSTTISCRLFGELYKFNDEELNQELQENFNITDLKTSIYNFGLEKIGTIEEYSPLDDQREYRDMGDFLLRLTDVKRKIEVGEYIYKESGINDPIAITNIYEPELSILENPELNPTNWLHLLYIPDRELFSLFELPKHYYNKKRIIEFFKDFPDNEKPPRYYDLSSAANKIETLYKSFRKKVELVLPKPKEYYTQDESFFKETPNFIGLDIDEISKFVKVFLYHFCKRDSNFNLIFGENEEFITEEEKLSFETHAVFPITVYVNVEKYGDIYPPDWPGWNKVNYQFPEPNIASRRFTMEDLTQLRIDLGNYSFINIYKHNGYRQAVFPTGLYQYYSPPEEGIPVGTNIIEEIMNTYRPRFAFINTDTTVDGAPVFSLNWFDYYINTKLLKKILYDNRITKIVIFVPYIRDIDFRIFEIFGENTIGDGTLTRSGFPIRLHFPNLEVNKLNKFSLTKINHKTHYITFFQSAIEYFKYFENFENYRREENIQQTETAWRNHLREELREYPRIFYPRYDVAPSIYIDITGINIEDLSGDNAAPIFKEILNNHMVFNLKNKWFKHLLNNVDLLVKEKAIRLGIQDYCLPDDLLNYTKEQLLQYWQEKPWMYNKMSLFTCLNRICFGLGLIYEPELNPIFEPTSFIKGENLNYFIPSRIVPDSEGEDEENINIFDPFTWSSNRRNKFFDIVKKILENKRVLARNSYHYKDFGIDIGITFFKKYTSGNTDHTSYARAYYFNPEEKRIYWSLNPNSDIYSYKLHTSKEIYNTIYVEQLSTQFLTDPSYSNIDILSTNDSSTYLDPTKWIIFDRFNLNLPNPTNDDNSNFNIWCQHSSFDNIRISFFDIDSTDKVLIDSNGKFDFNIGLDKYYANYVNEQFTITFLIQASLPIIMKLEGSNVESYFFVINPQWVDSIKNLNDLTNLSVLYTNNPDFEKTESFTPKIHFLNKAEVYLCIDKTGPMENKNYHTAPNIIEELNKEKFVKFGIVTDIKEEKILGSEYYRFTVRADNTLRKEYQNREIFVLFRQSFQNLYDARLNTVRYISNKIKIINNSYNDRDGFVTRTLYVYNPIDCTDETQTLLKRHFKKEVIENNNIFLYSIIGNNLYPIGEKIYYYCYKTISGRFFESIRFNACLQNDPICRLVDLDGTNCEFSDNTNGRFINRFPWITNRFDLFKLFYNVRYKIPVKVKKIEYEINSKLIAPIFPPVDDTSFYLEKGWPIFSDNYLLGFCTDVTSDSSGYKHIYFTSKGEDVPFLEYLIKKITPLNHDIYDNTSVWVKGVSYKIIRQVVNYKSFPKIQTPKSILIAEKKNIDITVPSSVKFLLDTPFRKLYAGDNLYMGANPDWIRKRKEYGQIRNVLKRDNDKLWEVYIDKFTFDTIKRDYDFSYPFYIRREIKISRDDNSNFYTTDLRGLSVGDNIFLDDSNVFSDLFVTKIVAEYPEDKKYEITCRGTRYRPLDDNTKSDIISIGSKIPIVGYLTSVFSGDLNYQANEFSFMSLDAYWEPFVQSQLIKIYVKEYGHNIFLGTGNVIKDEDSSGNVNYYLIKVSNSLFSIPQYYSSSEKLNFVLEDTSNIKYEFPSRIFNIKIAGSSVILGTIDFKLDENYIFDPDYLIGKKLYLNSSNKPWAIITEKLNVNKPNTYTYLVEIQGSKYYTFNLLNSLLRVSNFQDHGIPSLDQFYKKQTFWYQIDESDKPELGVSKIINYSFRYLSFKTGSSGIEFVLREMYDRNSVFRMFGLSDFMANMFRNDLLVDGLFLRSVPLRNSSSINDNVFALIAEEGYPRHMNTINDYLFYSSRLEELTTDNPNTFRFNFNGVHSEYLKKYYINIPFRLGRKELENYSISYVPVIFDKFSDSYYSTFIPSSSHGYNVDNFDRNSFLIVKGIENSNDYNSSEWVNEIKYKNNIYVEFSKNRYSNYNFLSFFNNKEFKKFIQYFFLLGLDNRLINFLQKRLFNFSDPITVFNYSSKYSPLDKSSYNKLLGKHSYMFYTGATSPYFNYDERDKNINSNLDFKGINIMNNGFSFNDSFFFRLVYLPLYTKRKGNN